MFMGVNVYNFLILDFFIITIILTSLFGLGAGFFENIYIICLAFFMVGVSFGGNLPIAGVLLLESIPPSKQSLLTLLSVWWPVGQVLASVISWMTLSESNSCVGNVGDYCSPALNYGWRHVCYYFSAVTVISAFLGYLFNLRETPKYLVSVGKYEDAVNFLNKLAHENGKILKITAADFEISRKTQKRKDVESKSKLGRIKPLFIKELRVTTILIWFIWMFVAIGYNMFNVCLPGFLQHSGAETLGLSETYRNYVIVSFSSIPGSIVGMFLTDSKLGRKGTMAFATGSTALALLLFTKFTSPTGQLVMGSINGSLQNLMYGVIYAYTPEVFPTSIRNTAYGIAASVGHLSGAVAPFATFSLINLSYLFPIYCSSAIILIAAFLMLCLPDVNKVYVK